MVPPAAPSSTDQVTPRVGVPSTMAVKVWVALLTMVKVGGRTRTVTVLAGTKPTTMATLSVPGWVTQKLPSGPCTMPAGVPLLVGRSKLLGAVPAGVVTVI